MTKRVLRRGFVVADGTRMDSATSARMARGCSHSKQKGPRSGARIASGGCQLGGGGFERSGPQAIRVRVAPRNTNGVGLVPYGAGYWKQHPGVLTKSKAH